ncbi:MAG: sulfatase [Planctomycetes bacterium]|nr:sulfatase [Planctomycetota bacterium]
MSDVRAADAAKRPNILWITCEDMSPDLGCYGDKYAVTPTIDRLASQGARYTHVFTHAPVCAPSRSGLITGVYPTMLGTMHMRSKVAPPEHVRCFPAYLRQAGYFCTNNAKTDYNFDVPKDAWDRNGAKAHWRDRPDKDQPFFAVFNFIVTHESQARATPEQYEKNTQRLTAEQRHDPTKAKLPSYYPDTPTVRKNWAMNHDNITALDYLVADKLAELEADGLSDNTIVFFFSDHGRGLPRCKRWPYDSGLRVPLLVRWPGKIAPGTVVDELVAFVDLAPTVLSLAGVDIPTHMQGQAFLGPKKADKPREYVYGARDRMDERYDMIRTVRDKRYRYVRNFMPWEPYFQHIWYCEQMPIMQEYRRLAANGELKGPAASYFAGERPSELLFDSEADPEEVNNLAGDSQYLDVLIRLSQAQDRWCDETNDLGLLPESLMYDAISGSPSDWRERIVKSRRLKNLLYLAAPPEGEEFEAFKKLTGSDDPMIRWWMFREAYCRVPGAILSPARAEEHDNWLGVCRVARKDSSPIVRTLAIRVFAFSSTQEAIDPTEWAPLLSHDRWEIALAAAIELDELGERAKPMIDELQQANERERPNDYIMRVTAHTLEQLGVTPKRGAAE